MSLKEDHLPATRHELFVKQVSQKGKGQITKIICCPFLYLKREPKKKHENKRENTLFLSLLRGLETQLAQFFAKRTCKPHCIKTR